MSAEQRNSEDAMRLLEARLATYRRTRDQYPEAQRAAVDMLIQLTEMELAKLGIGERNADHSAGQ